MAHARRPSLSESAIGVALDETLSSYQTESDSVMYPEIDASYISVSEDEYDPEKDNGESSDSGGSRVEIFKGEITLPIQRERPSDHETAESDDDDDDDDDEVNGLSRPPKK